MRIRHAVPVVAVVVLAVSCALVPVSSAGAAAEGSSGCGRKAISGTATRHLTVDGHDREYLLSIPESYAPREPAPLVFNFHGLGSNMQEQARYSELEARGGARGYVVITPNGEGTVLRHWSLTPSPGANPDVAFTRAMLAATKRSLCIDPGRVYATGMSNGAIFTTVLACSLPGRFAAIAPVAGSNATAVCRASAPPVSIIAFHGTADPIVPYQGGDYFSGPAASRAVGLPRAKPVDDALAAWAAFDGCGTPPATEFAADDVQHVTWPDCPRDGTVELYRVVGGGHTWPGGLDLRSERLGTTTSSISATDLMLDLFATHPR